MENQDPQIAKLQLEVENLKQQNEKLGFELDELRNEKPSVKLFRRWLPVLSWLITAIAVPSALFQYVQEQSKAREQGRAEEVARVEAQIKAREDYLLELKRETAKPFWDRQLGLYIEAVEKAAIIATTANSAERQLAADRFWVLYWGPLAAVEDVGLTKSKTAAIEGAMVAFGNLITTNRADTVSADTRQEMKYKSLDLAHAVRNAIGPAFSIELSELHDLRKKQAQK